MSGHGGALPTKAAAATADGFGVNDAPSEEFRWHQQHSSTPAIGIPIEAVTEVSRSNQSPFSLKGNVACASVEKPCPWKLSRVSHWHCHHVRRRS